MTGAAGTHHEPPGRNSHPYGCGQPHGTRHGWPWGCAGLRATACGRAVPCRGRTALPGLPRGDAPTATQASRRRGTRRQYHPVPPASGSQSSQIPLWCKHSPVRQRRQIYPSLSPASVRLPAASGRRAAGNLFPFQLGQAGASERGELGSEESPFSFSPGAGHLPAPSPAAGGIAAEAEPAVILALDVCRRDFD